MGRIAGVTATETRDRLVAAAARVVADQGFGGARVGDIAREAGLTTGAIYAHFRSKDELLAAATRDQGTAELGALLAGGGDDLDVVALLRGLARRLGRPAGDEDGSLLVESAVAARRDPDVGRRISRQVAAREQGLAALLAGAGSSGAVDASLPAGAVSRLALTFALGSLLVRALDLDPVDEAEWAVVADRLVDALLPPAEPAPLPPAQPAPLPPTDHGVT
jgi:AcrR family transcriptional regulator